MTVTMVRLRIGLARTRVIALVAAATRLTAIAMVTACSNDDAGEKAIGHRSGDTITHTDRPAARGWSVAPDATVRLYVPAGRVTVRAWDRDSVDLQGTLHANASLFGGGASTHVKVGVEAYSQTDGTLPRATLEVRVPPRARLWIKMIDGELSVSGTQVELEAYTVRGVVEVRDARGSTTIESIDAPVRLSHANGDVRIRGSRAAVVLDSVDALASVATVSGPVELRASRVEGRIETVGGAVRVDGVRRGGVLAVQSHAGDITLIVPASATPRLTLWSRGGVVRDSLPAGNARYGTIEARSFKGSVVVVRRQ